MMIAIPVLELASEKAAMSRTVCCWDTSSDGWFGEFGGPPVEIRRDLSGRGAWKVRTVVENSEHGFQASEVWSSVWVGQSRM